MSWQGQICASRDETLLYAKSLGNSNLSGGNSTVNVIFGLLSVTFKTMN